MKFGIRELAFVVVMLGLLGCSYFLVLTKAQQKVAAQERKIEERQKALADLDKATAGVADVDRKVEELQEAIKFFEKKLPQEREMDLILKEVWQMAEQNRLAALRLLETFASLIKSKYECHAKEAVKAEQTTVYWLCAACGRSQTAC